MIVIGLSPSRRRRVRPVLVLLAAVASLSAFVSAQSPVADTFDQTVPPGANYDKANFRLWVPGQTDAMRAVLVLVPGSNADGRAEASDPVWRAFATRYRLALVACQLTDKPHELPFIEEYANASKGSGQALLDALGALAVHARRPEIAAVPLLLWGMSAGGQFNYELVAWKPERVLAFVVNKGGIYYTALAPRAARSVPGILFTGEKDLWSRNDTIEGLFAVNRRAGALWALAEEPNAAHVVGRSRELAMVFFEDVLDLRLGGMPGAGTPTQLAEKAGFLGDITTRTIAPAVTATPGGPTAWLPTERVARAWQAMVTGQPFDR